MLDKYRTAAGVGLVFRLLYRRLNAELDDVMNRIPASDDDEHLEEKIGHRADTGNERIGENVRNSTERYERGGQN